MSAQKSTSNKRPIETSSSSSNNASPAPENEPVGMAQQAISLGRDTRSTIPRQQSSSSGPPRKRGGVSGAREVSCDQCKAKSLDELCFGASGEQCLRCDSKGHPYCTTGSVSIPRRIQSHHLFQAQYTPQPQNPIQSQYIGQPQYYPQYQAPPLHPHPPQLQHQTNAGQYTNYPTTAPTHAPGHHTDRSLVRAGSMTGTRSDFSSGTPAQQSAASPPRSTGQIGDERTRIDFLVDKGTTGGSYDAPKPQTGNIDPRSTGQQTLSRPFSLPPPPPQNLTGGGEDYMMGPSQPMVPRYGPPTQFLSTKEFEAQQNQKIRAAKEAEKAAKIRAKEEKKLADKQKKLTKWMSKKDKRDKKNEEEARKILEARGGPSQFE